jgi:hypothetical protein
MATLRMIFREFDNQMTPTFYKLQGVGEDPTENTYSYNVSRVASNFAYFPLAYLYCDRKIDFSGMADNEVKKVKGVGAMITITNHQDHTTNISMDSNALQCVTWGHCVLGSLSDTRLNGPKHKLPHYILVSDLTQLRENVFFHVLWSDNKRHHFNHAAGGKFIDITFNLFPDND